MRSEWKELALKVKERDGFKCKKCGSTKKLQCHHKVYIKNNKPWEYKMCHLETLCDTCHKLEHKSKPISEFRLKTKERKKKTTREPKTELEKKRAILEKQGKIVRKEFNMKLEKSEDYYKKKAKRKP